MSTRTLPPALDLADLADHWLSDLDTESPDGVSDALAQVRRLIARLEAVAASLIGEAEKLGVPAARGFGSTTSWLIAATGDQPGECRSRVRVARRLRHMPLTREAFHEGQLSEARVRTLVTASDTSRELFARDEGVLVDQARSLDARSFQRAVGYWRRLADQDRFADDQEAMFERRRVHLSPTWVGMGRIDGDLDPESHEIVATAIRTITDPSQLDPFNLRSPAQRRADALVEIHRYWLDHASVPAAAGERPHITVTVDLHVLEQRAGGRCELGSGAQVTGEAARRLACDAQITRVITDADSLPLDVGRATRTIPTGIRNALHLRDAGCTHLGCPIPPGWCDAHHIRHWANGGPTTLANLTLLCRRHHRQSHSHAAYPKRE